MELTQNVSKCLEYEFHSSSYHTLNEAVNGLRTMLSHLATVCVCVCACVGGVVCLSLMCAGILQALSDEGMSVYEKMTLLQFVISQYGTCKSTEESSRFTVIGIRK